MGEWYIIHTLSGSEKRVKQMILDQIAKNSMSEFFGGKSKPYPLSAKEIKNIFEQLESEKKEVTSAKLYEVGEAVIVTDGPFDSFNGVIDDIDNEKLRLRVSISIFGKATPIDLAFNQVKKV